MSFVRAMDWTRQPKHSPRDRSRPFVRMPISSRHAKIEGGKMYARVAGGERGRPALGVKPARYMATYAGLVQGGAQPDKAATTERAILRVYGHAYRSGPRHDVQSRLGLEQSKYMEVDQALPEKTVQAINRLWAGALKGTDKAGAMVALDKMRHLDNAEQLDAAMETVQGERRQAASRLPGTT